MHRYVFFSKWYADFLLLCHWRYILPQSYHSRPSISIHKSPLSIEKQVSCACNLDGNLWRWRALWIPVGYCCCCLSSVWRSGPRTTPGPRTRLDQDQSSKAAVENVWSWSLNFEKWKDQSLEVLTHTTILGLFSTIFPYFLLFYLKFFVLVVHFDHKYQIVYIDDCLTSQVTLLISTRQLHGYIPGYPQSYPHPYPKFTHIQGLDMGICHG